MSRIEFEPWEPEESVGKLWHAFASRLDGDPIHDGARVPLSQVGGRLAVLFRGLGGDPAVEIKPVAAETSHHRLSFLRRLGTWAEATPRASFDGATLRLPESLAAFPDPRANAALYLWLAAAAVALRDLTPSEDADPLQADLAALETAKTMTAAALRLAPGYTKLHADLCEATLLFRRTPNLPPVEAAVEARIRAALGANVTLPPLPAKAPRGYRPFKPVPLWPDLRVLARSEHTAVEARATEGPPEESEEKTARKARRRKADQADRNDSFILHKFEAILSMTEFLNLNRRVEDDDEDTAKKAADDQEEIGLAQVSKAPATRLKLHLDLAPEDVDREQISGSFTYPEWDVRTASYLPSHARVLHSRAEASDLTPPFRADPRASARIRAVRRQFEALRPSLVSMPGYPDGDVLDTERAVRARVDFLANGEGTDRVWRQTRPERRDLAVSILLDISRSTESAIPGHGHDGRSVIDIEREALAALAWGLDACGDSFAIHAFSSLKRNRVFVQEVKRFAEPMAEAVEHRIAALKPGHYTRLGAAIRHMSALLAKEARKRRLLLVITDGKPNDLDHYEGRHGIEDSRMAVQEARRAGHAVFGITVDRDGKSWFPRLFGQGAFALIPHPEKLTQALPQIYRQLVTG
ncbi:VWA domain-containing protein [Tabrizicola sp.]|jgi:nitric oxide reductase NorD protein|uniref:nitric oxide reductase activation protein NorD n=1 Tax=Tabrizicola sp. TaxID=2005166 RepID=UPI001A386057|nr:VWA domain-containing protein [Tabrizicola sp.]MBL9061852.1 VWA domain-containing protein [Tabrizicola sp.]